MPSPSRSPSRTHHGLAARMLRAIRPGSRDLTPVAERGPDPGYCATIEASVRLDEAISDKLDEAVGRTEQSALAIMGQVRDLCDRSASLVGRLGAATAEAGQFEAEIQGNVDALEQMADFLARLPERLHRDLDHIAGIAAEIKSLSGLAENVQAVSMQSHMLSINAAIEASRAGPGGEAFKVVAQEVRQLAANSHGAATAIGKSLTKIRAILKDGLEDSAARSSSDLDQIHATAEAVTQLRASCSRIVGTYQAGFADMLEHGEMISHGSSEVLGQLQYQDIVRQCVERLQNAIGKRNAVLEKEFGARVAPRPELVAALIGDVLEEYLAGEALHGGAADANGGSPAIELF